MYRLNLMGQNSVGIGSISGDIDPIISNCYMEINNVAISAVGIGSVMGRCDMMIEHASIKMDFSGTDVVMIGSKRSEKLRLSIYSCTVNFSAQVDDVTVFGSSSGNPSNITIDFVSIRTDIGGKTADIFRGHDKSVKVRLSNSRVSGLSTWAKQWEVEGTTSVTASWLLWVSARP